VSVEEIGSHGEEIAIDRGEEGGHVRLHLLGEVVHGMEAIDIHDSFFDFCFVSIVKNNNEI